MFDNRRLLNQSEINKFLNNNKSWILKDNGIERTLSFAKYMNGIEFINKLAIKAEELNHHPDLIVGWCKVQVRFSTHDLGGISTFDLEMAESSDSFFNLLNN